MTQSEPIADVRVDVATIEKQLAELWRSQKEDREGAVTRAALWNVVAHTWDGPEHAHAAEILALASEAVPQRTIIIQSDPDGPDSIESWISANCHLVGKGKQVCSEEVSIVASGKRVHHIGPLVSALLLPDMPVAVWWLGDLPEDSHEYAEMLLEPADRLIVDSSNFSSISDLDLVCRIAAETTTAPADLNWVRLEEWRAATASLFDPPAMRDRLQRIRNVRVIAGGGTAFGDIADSLLYGAWLTAQTGHDVPFDIAREGGEKGIAGVEIHFEDGAMSLIRRDVDRRVVTAHSDRDAMPLDGVTRAQPHSLEDLIVRLLEQPQADSVFLKTIRIARSIPL